jgi:hypothetical protein
MILDEDLCTLELKIPKDIYDDLDYKSWKDGFDEPEEAVLRLINKYLRRTDDKPEFTESEMAIDTFRNEIESITTFTRFLNFVQNILDSQLKRILLSLYSIEVYAKKIVIDDFNANGKSLGHLLRLARTTFDDEFSITNRNIIYFGLIKQFPDQKNVIMKELVFAATAKLRKIQKS